jgi:small GTP-binding protein
LFNRLLGEDRSIVSQEAGTTRDVVRESLSIGGLLFRLSDTAGIRSTGNEIEAKGIERSFGEASSAHLILWIFDGTKFRNAGELSAQRERLGREARILAVWNKVDVAGHPPKDWEAFFSGQQIPAVGVSALDGRGIPELFAAISSLFATRSDDQPDFWISRTRHFEVLGKAVESVREAVAKVKAGERYPDLLAADLRAALHARNPGLEAGNPGVVIENGDPLVGKIDVDFHFGQAVDELLFQRRDLAAGLAEQVVQRALGSLFRPARDEVGHGFGLVERKLPVAERAKAELTGKRLSGTPALELVHDSPEKVRATVQVQLDHLFPGEGARRLHPDEHAVVEGTAFLAHEDAAVEPVRFHLRGGEARRPRLRAEER